MVLVVGAVRQRMPDGKPEHSIIDFPLEYEDLANAQARQDARQAKFQSFMDGSNHWTNKFRTALKVSRSKLVSTVRNFMDRRVR